MPTWIRVKDRDTGHEYDLHEEDPRLRTDVVEVIKGYPANSSSTAQARAPKHRVDKAGQPVDVPRGEGDQDPPADVPPADEPPQDGLTPPADDPPGDDPAADKTTAGTSAKKRRSN